MIDFASITEAAARDPLVVILGVFVIGGLTAHFLFKRHPIGRAVVRVIFLILLTIALLRADIVPSERSEEHTSELQSHVNLVCRLLLEKKNVAHHSRTIAVRSLAICGVGVDVND